MQCAALLQCSPPLAAALFDGALAVPTIASLQQWLEVAWRAGYDKQGAAQLSHRVVGTKKWVGTTECAALLRYFGLSAQIVDFLDAKGSGEARSVPTVACDGCGRTGLNLEGYHHSDTIEDYDLCDMCFAKQRHHLDGDSFQRVPAQQAVAAAAAAAAGGERRHAALLQWVWRHFSEGQWPQQRHTHAQCPSRVRVSGRLPLFFQYKCVPHISPGAVAYVHCRRSAPHEHSTVLAKLLERCSDGGAEAHGAKRELSRPFWKPSPERAALLSAFSSTLLSGHTHSPTYTVHDAAGMICRLPLLLTGERCDAYVTLCSQRPLADRGGSGVAARQWQRQRQRGQ
jgi:hypothetical protein